MIQTTMPCQGHAQNATRGDRLGRQAIVEGAGQHELVVVQRAGAEARLAEREVELPGADEALVVAQGAAPRRGWPGSARATGAASRRSGSRCSRPRGRSAPTSGSWRGVTASSDGISGAGEDVLADPVVAAAVALVALVGHGDGLDARDAAPARAGGRRRAKKTGSSRWPIASSISIDAMWREAPLERAVVLQADVDAVRQAGRRDALARQRRLLLGQGHARSRARPTRRPRAARTRPSRSRSPARGSPGPRPSFSQMRRYLASWASCSVISGRSKTAHE